MGIVAAISAVRPDVGEDRNTFEDRLRDPIFAPCLPWVQSYFDLDLSGNWRSLLTAFSGGAFDHRAQRYDWLIEGEEGVWAVRGRHPVLPSPGRKESDPYEMSIYYNDDEDVAAISAWLEKGPAAEFMSYFRAEHERYVDEMIAEGCSEREIQTYAGGGRTDAPYLGLWEYLTTFYQRARSEELWVKCYIG